MKTVHRMLGVLIGISLPVILLLSAFEIGAYSDFGWYEKEYRKYGVLKDLEMNMEDVMEVTKEMMSYLRKNREDLTVNTYVAGQEQEFFNAREKAHMEDVQELFVGGLWIRRGAILFFLLAIFLVWKTKADGKRLIPKTFIYSIGSVFVIVVAAGMLFMSDFTKYFTIFHELFFDNDLWLLDPDTDLLIRMLPEGFFLDMVIRIGVIFFIMLIIILIISIAMLKLQKNKEN